MATWRDIEAIRDAHPEWGCSRIARELRKLGTNLTHESMTAWVRSTFQRRGWPNPKSNDPTLRAAAKADADRRRQIAEEQFRQRCEFKMREPETAAPVEPPPVGVFSRAVEKTEPYWLRD
jgi:hypothetical protein